MEPLAERALVIGELHHGQRRVLRAEHGEALQVQLGARDLLLLRRLLAGSLLLQQLPDLAQLVQNLVGLLARDALFLRRPSGSGSISASGSAANFAYRKNFFMRS